MMKKVYVFLIALTLCIGCKKREVGIDQYNVDPSIQNTYSDATGSALDLLVAETIQKIEEYALINLPVAEAVQKVIEEYATSAPELSAVYSEKRNLVFQIDGNFTGSGNREIIGFYESHRPREVTIASLDTAFCFVLDSSGEKIERVYYVGWGGTLEFNEKDEADAGLTNALGKYIIWRDRKIGCIGDFNGNGKEELYLYSITGFYMRPYFFEFNETEFVELLDLGVENAYITSVDSKEKIIKIKIVTSGDEGTIIENRIYIWDNAAMCYKMLSSTFEIKKYVWNWETEQYEEI